MKISKAALGYKIMGYCCAYTPSFVLKIILPFLAGLFHRFDSRHVGNVKKNLDILSKHTGRDFSGLEKKVYKNFAFFMAEFFKAGIRRDVFLQENLKKKINDTLGQPGEKANLILVGHYGNWELALKQLLGMGYSVTTIAMNHSDSNVDKFFSDMRNHENITVAYLNQGLKPCIRALRNKEIIALACERDYTGNGIAVNIAGQEVGFPHGPAWLISKYNPDTYLGIYKRKSFGEFDSILEKFDFKDSLSEVSDITQEISDKLFHHIYEDPSQWITFDDFFGSAEK
jgi:lauroyl/myristoyl acyltransferase